MDASRPDDGKYQALFEHAADAMLALEGDLIVECNAQATKLFGCDREKLIGQPIHNLSPERQPDERYSKEKALELINAAMGYRSQRFEWLHSRCDGTSFEAEVAVNRVDFDEEILLVGVIRDITKRKRLEDAIHNIAAGISAATGDSFLNLLVQYISRALGAQCVYVGELIGEKRIHAAAVCMDTSPGASFDIDLPGTPCEKVISGKLSVYPRNVRQLFPNDPMLERCSTEGYIGVPLLDSHNETIGLLSALLADPIEDVSFAEYIMRTFAARASGELERKKSLQSLLDEKRLTETIINTLPGVFYMIDETGKGVWWNKLAEELFELRLDEDNKVDALSYVVEKDREAALQSIQKVLSAGRSTIELRVIHKDNSIRNYYFTGARIEVGGHLYAVGAGVDITELRQMEEALSESERKFRTIFENAPVGIFQSTVDGRFLSVNPAAAHMFGYSSPEELVGAIQSIPDQLFVHPEWRPGFINRAIETGGFLRFENEYRRKDGSIFIANLYVKAVRVSGRVAFLEGFVEDITDRKRGEEEKRFFYRETLLSVTGGKLIICDTSEVQPYISSSLMTIDVRDPNDLAAVRSRAREFCKENGLAGNRLESFLIGIGEAATNAVKHANGGVVFAGILDNAVWVGVSDRGTGIEYLALPRALLLRGFSTKPSLGIGYSVMLDVADRILLATGREGTTVILVKELEEPPRYIPFDQLPDTWEESLG